MPEGVGYLGSNTQFSGAGLGVYYINGIKNKYLYAYSGSVNVDTTETDLLNFQTGNSIGMCSWEGGYNSTTNADYSFVAYINGILVARFIHDLKSNVSGQPRTLLLPPNSLVRITGQNTGDSSTNAIWSHIIGKVHK